MPHFSSTADGATIFYRLYVPDTLAHRPNQAATSPLTLVFLHGWPMSSRMFDQLIVPLCETYRYRCVAPDRRGFGNSDWNSPSTGTISFDTLITDLVGLLEHLAVGPFVFIGASMGTQESVLAYLRSPFIRDRCKGFVWMGPNMPYPVQCEESPTSPPQELWDALLDGIRGPDGKKFIADQVPSIFRADLRPVDSRILQFYERLVCQADPVAVERMTKLFSVSFVGELQQLAQGDRLPILIMHGDSDNGMPLTGSAEIVKKMLPWSELSVYEKAGHGLYLTHADQVLREVLDFLEKILVES